MAHEPERPAAVPEQAEWHDDEMAWCLVQPGAEDGRHESRRAQGAHETQETSERVQQWRADGSLLFEGQKLGGVLDGPFKRFHPSGQVASAGRYRKGHPDGVVVAYASDEPGAELLRGCCVPVGAQRMDARYEGGSLRGETFFDAEGYPLLSNGQRRPTRPTNVPEDAGYEESTQRFFFGPYDSTAHVAHGTWRWWRLDGSLAEEADYENDHRAAMRRFDAAGVQVESIGLLVQESYSEIRHGPWWRRLTAETAPGIQTDVFAIEAAQVNGCFDRGQAVGVWSFSDADGKPCLCVDLGEALFDEKRLRVDVLDLELADVGAWHTQADRLVRAGRVREALWAAARGAGTQPDLLRVRLAAHTLPVSVDRARQIASAAVDDDKRSLASLLDALIRGGDPVAILRALATQTGKPDRAGLDFVNAAIALDPDRDDPYLTRALLCIERGMDVQVEADAAHVRDRLPESAAFLDDYLRIMRPDYDWGLVDCELPELSEDIPVVPAQPLDRITRTVAVYATRIGLLRQELLRFRPDAPAWLPPDLSGLLPDGPIDLENGDAVILDENEEGQEEQTTVAINERLDSDLLASLGVSGLMRLVRANWAGLCWLLWAVGCVGVEMPRTLAPHPDFPRALGMALSRAWRARDVLITGGLRAATQRVPGFLWQGMDIETMPANFVEIACEEYEEIRAVLLWLSNEGNISPFQSDLRQI